MAVAAMALTSCNVIYEYDNCPPYDVEYFSIRNDWSEAPDAEPEGMAYIFFPDDGGAFWRFDFPGREAGRVGLPAGSYSYISYNDDTHNTLFREDSYAGYEAYTLPTELERMFGRAEDVPEINERVLRSPDMIWAEAYSAVELSYNRLAYNPSATGGEGTETVALADMTLPSVPRRMVARYSYRIEDVENLSGVARMCAAMSGLAGSLNLVTGARGREAVTVPSPAKADAGKTGITGSFYTFGLPGAGESPNILCLYVWLTDGRKLNFSFDVSEQVRTAPDPMDVEVVVRGLHIPESEISGGAFDVNVDGWINVVVNIKV